MTWRRPPKQSPVGVYAIDDDGRLHPCLLDPEPAWDGRAWQWKAWPPPQWSRTLRGTPIPVLRVKTLPPKQSVILMHAVDHGRLRPLNDAERIRWGNRVVHRLD